MWVIFITNGSPAQPQDEMGGIGKLMKILMQISITGMVLYKIGYMKHFKDETNIFSFPLHKAEYHPHST